MIAAIFSLVSTLLLYFNQGLCQNITIVDGPGYAKAVCDEITYNLRATDSYTPPDITNVAVTPTNSAYDGELNLTSLTLNGLSSPSYISFQTTRIGDTMNENGTYAFPNAVFLGSLTYTYQAITINATFTMDMFSVQLMCSVNITVRTMQLNMSTDFSGTDSFDSTKATQIVGATQADNTEISNNGANYLPDIKGIIYVIGVNALSALMDPEETCFNAKLRSTAQCDSNLYFS